eukprot:jgi/Orpsp1_1/1179453/evm.model.c7180000069414.1
MKDNGEEIEKTLKYFISTKNNDLLRKKINYYLINKEYVLKLLYIYKNKIKYSTRQVKELIATSNENYIFNIGTYFNCLRTYDRKKNNDYEYICSNNGLNLEGLNLIYDMDIRNKDIKLKEIKYILLYHIYYSYPSNQAINTINNTELKNEINKYLANISNYTSNKKIVKNIMKNIFELVQKNNITQLDNYIIEKNIDIAFFNSNFINNRGKNLIKYAIDNNCSFEMLEYLREKCDYKNYNIVYNHHDNETSLLYYTIAKNKFEYSSFLLEKGVKINDDDRDNYRNIFISLMMNNQLNRQNFDYILNHNLIITSNILWYLFKENKYKELKYIFKKSKFSNSFIITLLNLRKNNSNMSKKDITRLIEVEKNKLIKILYDKNFYRNFINKNSKYQDHPLFMSFLCNNDLRIDFLEHLFQDINNIPYNGYYVIDWVKKEHEDNKLLFIENIKNGNLKISKIDNYFLDNLYHSDDIKCNITNYIDENKYNELKTYITDRHIHLTYFNNHDGNFDILIKALENNVSLEMIYLIISHYSTLNYYVSDSTSNKYKTPLYSIFSIYDSSWNSNDVLVVSNSDSFYVEKNKFEMITLLLENGADINYKVKNTDIISLLCQNQLLCKEDLYFILDQGFTVTSELIPLFIYYNKEIFLEVILSRLIKDNSELIIKYDWLNDALANNNLNIVKMLFKYGKMDETSLSNTFDLCGLILEAMEHNNYYFINKLLSSENKYFNFEIFNFEDFFSKKYICFFPTEKKHFRFIKYFIKKLVMHPLFDFEKISYGNVILNLYEIKKYFFIKCFIKYSINNKTLNYDKIDLKKIFITLCLEKNKYIQTKNLIKMLIVYSLNHKTFDFKNDDFEGIFSLICQYYIYPKDLLIKNRCYKRNYYNMNPLEFLCNYHNFHLIKLYISQSFKNKFFDFKKVDIASCLARLHRLFHKIDSIPILKYFIEKMIESDHYDIQS